MKLWHSFTKELLLSSKGFYFWIELIMAFLIMFVLMFVVPENFNKRTEEIIYIDPVIEEVFLVELMEIDEDGVKESVEMKSGGEVYLLDLIVTKDKELYLAKSLDDLIELADTKKPAAAAHIFLDDEYNVRYDYYIQGYESERLQNLYKVIHMENSDILQEEFDKISVDVIGEVVEPLTDRENMVPPLLVLNGSLLGMFIIASYIFLDRGEGIIKAYSVTASSTRTYLLSKVLVLMVVSILSTLLIVIPILGGTPNYLAILLLLLTSAFFASSVGLIISTYFNSMVESFGIIYVLMLAMMLPSIAYFIPSWEPTWIKFLPTYALIQGFKESIIPNGDMSYILLASLGYVVIGAILFAFAEFRFKRILGA